MIALFIENINSYGSVSLGFDKWVFDRKDSALCGDLFPFTVSTEHNSHCTPILPKLPQSSLVASKCEYVQLTESEALEC